MASAQPLGRGFGSRQNGFGSRLFVMASAPASSPWLRSSQNGFGSASLPWHRLSLFAVASAPDRTASAQSFLRGFGSSSSAQQDRLRLSLFAISIGFGSARPASTTSFNRAASHHFGLPLVFGQASEGHAREGLLSSRPQRPTCCRRPLVFGQAAKADLLRSIFGQVPKGISAKKNAECSPQGLIPGPPPSVHTHQPTQLLCFPCLMPCNIQ